MNLDNLLSAMEAIEASDLHLKALERPIYRVNGSLQVAEKEEVIGVESMTAMLKGVLTEGQIKRFESESQVDFAYALPNGRRFRCNLYQDYRGPAAAFRSISSYMPTMEELGLPEVVESFADFHSGLVIVSGATGSGKTSTITSLINAINIHHAKHIITLEDPIEFRHTNKRSLVTQMGLHSEFTSFDAGIRSALRQDPDVIVVSEMRSLETIRFALLAAELGALVFTTLHTSGAAESIGRILDVFDASEQSHMRAILAESLSAVVSQVLLKRADHEGRVVATEILVNTSAVNNLIRQNRIHDLQSVIQSGGALGMRTLEESLENLVATGLVAPEEALPHSSEKNRLLGSAMPF